MRHSLTLTRLGVGISSALLAVGMVGFAATSGASAAEHTRAGAHAASPAQHRGGTLTALESSGYGGSWPAGLDPATNINGAAGQTNMSAIFGQLFELGTGQKIIPDLATGYHFAGGGHLVFIDIRKGVTFTDGTPFNAQAVAYNIKRDLAAPCSCKPTWPGKVTVSVVNPYEVELHFSVIYAPAVTSFVDANVNWIASPSAIAKMGAKQFALTPVGAGPFVVVNDTLSSVLTLKRNPHYWQAGHPYLNQLIIKSVGSDEAGIEAILAGQGQVFEDLSTPSLIALAEHHHLTVTRGLPTSAYNLQLNTAKAPFNNILARQAIYYATNISLIDKHLFNNALQLTQSFTAPGGLFYEPKVPGYIGYNLAKAKAIVKQLHGLTVNLGTLAGVTATNFETALQSEWSQAGIKTTIAAYNLAPLIQHFTSNNWESMLQTAGSFDPAAGVGVGFRFASTSPFSGVHDPHLQALLNAAAGSVVTTVRAKYYAAAAAYIAKMAYGPFYFSFGSYDVAAKGVSGPGLTTPLSAVVVTPDIPWEDVSYSG